MNKKTFCALLLAAFSSMLGLGIISPFLPRMADELHASGFWLGTIFSGFVITRMAATLMSDFVSGKMGMKRLLVAGLILYAVTFPFYPFAGSIYSLTLVRLVHGFASGLVLPVVISFVGNLVQPGREGTTMATYNMICYLGVASGPFLGSLFNSLLGFTAVFYAMLFLGLGACAAALCFVPAADTPKEVQGATHMPLRELLSHDIVKAVLIIAIIRTLGSAVLMSFVPLHAVKIHISVSEIGIIIFAGLLTAALLQIPFGRFADRISKFQKLYQILGGSFFGTFALFCVPFCTGFTGLLTTGVAIGLGTAISVPALMSVAVLIGHKTGMSFWMGIFTASLSSGFVIAPLTSGVVMDTLGLDNVFYIIASVSLLGTLLCTYYIRKRLKEYPVA